MSIAYIAGQPAFLPMDPYEVEKFLYDLSLDGPGAAHSFDSINDFRDFPIDWGSDFRIINRLFQRINDLGDLRDTLKAWCCARHAKACWEKCSPGAFLTHPCTAEDALRASYHMGSIMFIEGIENDEELGDFALENGMLEEFNDLPDEIYEALDKEKAGAKMREMEGGVFANGGYLVVSEDFSGEPLPAEEPAAHFQVRFSDERRDCGWFDVPLHERDERMITGVFGCDGLSALPMECRSIIPQLNGIISEPDELPELRLLDEALAGRSSEEIQKYKALLEVVKPESVGEAFRLADNLDHYDIELEYADPAAYGRQYLDDCYHFKQHDSLAPFIDYAGFGAAMLNEDGYLPTRYGALYMNVMAQSILAGPNTVYGGAYYCGRTEGFPTFVCWDPDAQKVWLELGYSAFYDPPDGDFSYYQQICEDWGARPCASQEDYERVLDELGAQPYGEVMAEDQGFGGMRGMA